MKEKAKLKEQDEYRDIPLDLIDTEGQSVRAAQDDDHVVELAMNIAQHGLLEPIIVRPKDNGRFQLDAGFHRLAAHHRLKRKTITAHIRTKPTASTKTIALIENIVRRDLSLVEEVEAVNHLHQDESLSPSQICDLLGKGRSWVDRRLMIPNLSENVKQELIDGRISISHAEIIDKLKDDAARNLVLNQTISGKLSTRQVNELTDLYLAAPQISEAIEAGLETARQIQTETKIYRKCEACREIYRLEDVRFVCVCPECWNIIETIQLQALEEKRKTEKQRA